MLLWGWCPTDEAVEAHGAVRNRTARLLDEATKLSEVMTFDPFRVGWVSPEGVLLYEGVGQFRGSEVLLRCTRCGAEVTKAFIHEEDVHKA